MLGKPLQKSPPFPLGIVQIAIGPPSSPQSNGHSGHFSWDDMSKFVKSGNMHPGKRPKQGKSSDAHLNLDKSSLNKCLKPTWQVFSVPSSQGRPFLSDPGLLVRSMFLVSLSKWVSERGLWNFTDVTLADEDTNSILTDKVN